MDINKELLLKEALEVHNHFLSESIKSSNIDINSLKEELKKIYTYVGKYDSIMIIALSNNYDHSRLEYMLDMTSKINKKEISEKEASIQADQILVDEIVKPSLEKNKKK